MEFPFKNFKSRIIKEHPITWLETLFSEKTCHAISYIAAELVCSVEQQHPFEIHLTHLIGDDVVFVP